MRSLDRSRYGLLLRRLRAARGEAGLTQAAVAQALGRPQSFVSKCEAGERRLDAVELLALARLYDKPLGYFVAEGESADGASLLVDEGVRASAGRRRGRRSRRR